MGKQTKFPKRLSDIPGMRWASIYALAGIPILIFFGEMIPNILRRLLAGSVIFLWAAIPLLGLFLRSRLTQAERDAALAPWTEAKLKRRIWIIAFIGAIFVMLLFYLFPAQFSSPEQ